MALDNFKQHEILFLLLYSLDIGGIPPDDELMNLIAEECKVAKRYVKDVMKKFNSLVSSLQECDSIISTALTEYSLQRIFSTDRNILRISVYELLFEKQLEIDVVFSEAKRLAKKFSMPESANFIQSVLGSILPSKNNPEDTSLLQN